MQQSEECPVCSYISTENNPMSMDGFDTIHVICPRCGRFSIVRTAQICLSDKLKNPLLSAWIRQKEFEGALPPEFDSKSLNVVLRNLPEYSPIEKQAIFLRAIMKLTEYPGAPVRMLLNIDFPLAWAANRDEFNYYIESLCVRGLIAIRDSEFPNPDNIIKVSITPSGWEYLDKYEFKSLLPDQVFIAMSFSEKMREAWKSGIELSIRDAGYRPYRVDEKPHNEHIDAKIITEIQNSLFLVADVTEQKQGVYYEAGYAQGLKKHVLWCVRKDDLKNVHFDTRQIGHVVWEDIEDLRKQLYEMICAVVGKNPKRRETGGD